MGTAMIQGWIKADLLKSLYILDPNDIDDSLTSHNDLFHVKLMESIPFAKIDIVVLAVKPQIMDQVCAELTHALPDNTPVLSIAAGKNTAYFRRKLKQDTPIIRTMPNTPAAIGKGISALYATDNVNDTQRSLSSSLLDAIGDTLWLDDETNMDAVTAVSGSGPAYIFYLIEALAKAGVEAGLPAEQANQLARQTIIGAAALAEDEKDTAPSTLRQNVTSPGGTTEAALNILMDGQFQDALTKAVLAALKRGHELAD